MENIIGPPVDGPNFFGREAEVRAFVELLDGHDILLLGPRRIGKTSIGRAVMQAVRKQDWQAIEINVASCPDEADFVGKLVAAIREHAQSPAGQAWAALRNQVGGWLGRVAGLEAALPGLAKAGLKLRAADAPDWTTLASDALRLLSAHEQRWLLYVDELPIFLNTLIDKDREHGLARVRRFLDWFRNDVRGLPECQSLRWFVTGSVGLDTLVQRHGMADTINSLKHEHLQPFDALRAEAMLQALASNYELDFDPQATAAMLDAVGWLQPYYLQRLFHGVRRRAHAATTQPADLRPLIAQAIDSFAGPSEDNDFHHWEKRLAMQLGEPDAAHARALLTHSSPTPAGARAESLLDVLQQRLPDLDTDKQRQKFIELRDLLLRDGYWQASDDDGVRRYRFPLKPLRAWWARRQAL